MWLIVPASIVLPGAVHQNCAKEGSFAPSYHHTLRGIDQCVRVRLYRTQLGQGGSLARPYLLSRRSIKASDIGAYTGTLGQL